MVVEDGERRELVLLLRRLSVELDAVNQRFADEHGLGRTDVPFSMIASLNDAAGLDDYRRAFDVGWSAAEVHTWLGAHSSTPVPQPLA